MKNPLKIALKDPQATDPTLFEVSNFDRDGNPLRVGDRVGFIMRGWFLPREQESFGIISEIDSRGGVRIQVIESYRHFTSSGRLACKETHVYFTHHIYDHAKRARIFRKVVERFELSIFRVDPEDLERRILAAQEAEDQAIAETRAAATRAAAQRDE